MWIWQKEDLIDLAFSPSEIEAKTRKIYRQVLAASETLDGGNFDRIATDDFRCLFELYDQHFFERFFQDNYRDRVAFRLLRPQGREGLGA